MSFIVPSGHDADALLATVVSLAEKVALPDWEAVIVLNDPALREALAPVAGDLVIVEAEGDALGGLYNAGAAAASGEMFVFLRPGVLYFKDGGMIEAAAADAVAGVPLRDTSMQPYCLGLVYDFNSVPRFNTDPAKTPDAPGGGVLALNPALFARLGGFDPAVANHLVEADVCMAAAALGIPLRFQRDGLALSFMDSFYDLDRGDEAWPRRIRFFAKWRGKLPKDEDFAAFAAHMMRA